MWLTKLRFITAMLALTTALKSAGDLGAQELKPEAKRTEYAQEYQHALTTAPETLPFRVRGPDANERVHFEPAGLRIRLPAGFPEQLPGTGLEVNEPVRGNFEITVGFEVLAESDPADAGKFGTRLTLGVHLDTPERNEASLSRRIDGHGATQFSTYIAIAAGQSRPRPIMRYFPTQAKMGFLRLVRADSVLSFYAAEGSRAHFVHLQDAPFSPLDLKAVYVNASTGGPKAFLDARFTELHVRADALSDSSAAPARALGPATDFKRWKWLALLGAALMILIALGFGLARRRRMEQT